MNIKVNFGIGLKVLKLGSIEINLKLGKLKNGLETFMIYGTDKLLVSFDGGNLSRPSTTIGRHKDWAHFDQGHKKMGFRCVQGFLNLEHCQEHDGGLIVYEGSHLKHESFFKGTGIETQGDWHKFDNDPREEFPDYFKDCKKVKVCCNIGDVVLWDSRTIHFAAIPDANKGATKCRMVVYTSYQPRSLATEANLKAKQKAFQNKRMTSHWAAETIKLFPKNPRTYGNQSLIDNFKFDSTTLPVLNDKQKKLAGLIPY
eukprot:gene2385-2947_t